MIRKSVVLGWLVLSVPGMALAQNWPGPQPTPVPVPGAPSTLDLASKDLRAAQEGLDLLISSGAITYSSPLAEATFKKIMNQLRTVAKHVEFARRAGNACPPQTGPIQTGPVQGQSIDWIIQDARAVQNMMMAQLGEKVFQGYILKARPDVDVVTVFNQMKVQFYGLLVDAARLDRSDQRVKSLANWGKQTEVVYPGATFGAKIISYEEYNSLNLSMSP